MSPISFPKTCRTPPELLELKRNIPIFIGHGTEDDIIPIGLAKLNHQTLTQRLGFRRVELHTYEGLKHTSSEEGYRDVIDFLKRIVPAQGADKSAKM